MLFLIALPKSFMDCSGSSNTLLKNPVTAPKLFTKKFTKSLKAIDTTSNEVLKKSAAFWFC